jgi:hypothetical protein
LIQLRVELIEMRDQLIDALGCVLSTLIGRDELAVERSNAARGVGEFPSDFGVVGLETVVRSGQRGDGRLQSAEIVGAFLDAIAWLRRRARIGRSRFRGCVRNEKPPVFEVERTEKFRKASSGSRRQSEQPIAKLQNQTAL